MTSIYYFSRYSEAIPLTKVDETSVAEATIEIFSRCGFPAEIPTDQGSVFMGKLMNQLCKLLSIKPIHTSPYHPQTDGLLERWHADLLAMIKKATNCKLGWDLFLPYVLLAYRQTPHSITTGFSPFQLIYGVNVRGPLEVLRDNWLEGSTPNHKLVEWVENAKLNLCDYDKSVKGIVEFSPGDMVLVRTPGLSTKFADSWSWPPLN